MKKLYTFAAILAVLGIFVIAKAKAGTQYNWGTSTGANWLTPDDTQVQLGQGLVIVSSQPYPGVGTSSTTAMGIASFTLTQIQQSTPTFNGQIAFCNNCSNTVMVVSTGTTTRGSFAGVYIATGSGGTTLTAPH